MCGEVTASGPGSPGVKGDHRRALLEIPIGGRVDVLDLRVPIGMLRALDVGASDFLRRLLGLRVAATAWRRARRPVVSVFVVAVEQGRLIRFEAVEDLGTVDL